MGNKQSSVVYTLDLKSPPKSSKKKETQDKKNVLTRFTQHVGKFLDFEVLNRRYEACEVNDISEERFTAVESETNHDTHRPHLGLLNTGAKLNLVDLYFPSISNEHFLKKQSSISCNYRYQKL